MNGDDGIRVAISVDLKVNLGNYESAAAFVSLSNIPVGASESDIEAALDTGKLAWSLIRDRAMVQAQELRSKTGARQATAATTPRDEANIKSLQQAANRNRANRRSSHSCDDATDYDQRDLDSVESQF